MASSPHRFASTRWSLVLAAGGKDATSARAALGDLCVMYWEPVFWYLRRRGHEMEKAMDLTQGFITSLLERGQMDGADPTRGRFRSYLLGALNHYVSNEERKARAQKRGGGVEPYSLDFEGAEARFSAELAMMRSPDAEFARRWALTVMEDALSALRQKYKEQGKSDVFELLHPLISGDKSEGRYRAIGEKLGMTEDAVKMAVSRMRKRYREVLRRRVAETVADPKEVDEELRGLIEALR